MIWSTHISFYIHTYIHTYLPTYLPTYIRTYIRTYVRTYLHTHIHTYTFTHIHIYIYIYLYISCVNIYICMCVCYLSTYICHLISPYVFPSFPPGSASTPCWVPARVPRCGPALWSSWSRWRAVPWSPGASRATWYLAEVAGRVLLNGWYCLRNMCFFLIDTIYIYIYLYASVGILVFWLRPKGRYIQDSWVQRSRGEKKNWQGKWWDFASKKQRCNWGCCWRKQRLKQKNQRGKTQRLWIWVAHSAIMVVVCSLQHVTAISRQPYLCEVLAIFGWFSQLETSIWFGISQPATFHDTGRILFFWCGSRCHFCQRVGVPV